VKTWSFDVGFRVVGHKANKRRPIRHAAAFAAYAACDPSAEVDREAYLSHFVFGRDFAVYLKREGSEAFYGGPCGAPWLWWDVDRPGDLGAALRDARRLAGAILDRYRDLDDDDLLIFLSGGKGVHVGIPAVWHPEPSPVFNAVAKRFCLDRAEEAKVEVDPMIYSKTRLFRAPNSRHPKTGLYKRRLSLDDLTHLKPEAVVELALSPEPFDIPIGPARCLRAADDWNEARRAVERRAERHSAARAGNATRLNALTLDFIRNGAQEGERANRLFRASANLAEFDCPAELAHALLTEAALDSGLTPGETRRQIECGLAHARRQREGGAS
jgi:hypothetical protein